MGIFVFQSLRWLATLSPPSVFFALGPRIINGLPFFFFLCSGVTTRLLVTEYPRNPCVLPPVKFVNHRQKENVFLKPHFVEFEIIINWFGPQIAEKLFALLFDTWQEECSCCHNGCAHDGQWLCNTCSHWPNTLRFASLPRRANLIAQSMQGCGPWHS